MNVLRLFLCSLWRRPALLASTAGVVALALTFAAPTFAQTYGGGGVLVHQAFIPATPPSFAGGAPVPNPGLMNCLGGVGFRVRDGIRLGGEGQYCRGSTASMAQGGLQTGWQDKNAGFYATAFATVGVGQLRVATSKMRFTSNFVYLSPTLGIGMPIGGIVALEGSIYGMLPLPILQRVNGERVTGSSFPHGGGQLSVLFGDFRHRKKNPKSRRHAKSETVQNQPEQAEIEPGETTAEVDQAAATADVVEVQPAEAQPSPAAQASEGQSEWFTEEDDPAWFSETPEAQSAEGQPAG